uniref:TFIIS N-terminal domain-containing protein n=1 Tax=Rhizophora mucronata TaxID=61149 RepID=A0A2P2M1Z4_RHIMU
MTLEDFFTLTEMKEGLTVPSRVRELVTVMQKEKDCVVKNIGDATRQWAAVASTIAATENKECLDLFIQLDGLWFFDRWLKDAQKFNNDTNDGFIEESITALLRALEKLQIDKERSMSSGIWITVNNLLNHNCSQIQDKAKALFHGWKEGMFSDKICESVQGIGEFHDGVLSCKSGRTECAVDFHPAKGSSDGDNNAAEPTSDDSLLSRGSIQPEKAEDVPAQPLINKIPSNTILDNKDAEDRLPGPSVTSVTSISIQESASLKETLSSSEGNSSTDIQKFSVSMQQNAEHVPDSQRQLSSIQGKLVASAKVEPGAISASGDATIAQENAEPTLQNNADVKEGDFCLIPSVICDGEISTTSAPKVGTDDVEATHHFTMQLPKSTTKDGLCFLDGLQDLSGTESRSEKPNELGSPLSQMKALGIADNGMEDSDDDKGLCSDGDEELRNGSDFSRPVTDRQIPILIDVKKSDIELEYGIIDALEVARQVAQEVEREVVDYREPSCSSSSGKIMKHGVRQAGSSDSVSEKPELHSAFPTDEMVSRQSQHAEANAVGEGCSINSDNLDAPAENGVQELESSQVTELAKEQDVNAEKCLCDFDLNQEVTSDDVEHPAHSTLTPVSVVSASRPAAASGSPAAPLQFEGTLGWKGSAATSAFHPASPHKTSDSDKTLETGSSKTSKQSQDCLDIDLNVAGGGDEKVIGIILDRQNPVSSGLQSGESSLELGPRRSDRPSLDLNRVSDDDDAPPSDLRMEGRLYNPQNGHRSPSPASSSSAMQPPMRNIDLNDRPLIANELSDLGLYHGNFSQIPSSHGGSRPAGPVISIMGKRVEVGHRVDAGRKDWIPQMLSSPNSKLPEPAIDANVMRMGNVFGMVPSASYTNSPAFGYNGFASAPHMSITSAMYGPGSSIPYLVDSRGAPVVPQIMGSASAISPYPQPPFALNTTVAPLGLGGVGSSRPNFDLNTGFSIDGGSMGGSRQLFMPSQGRSLETNSQHSSSTMVGGKRKEPDVGWEPYWLQNKHPQGPWR